VRERGKGEEMGRGRKGMGGTPFANSWIRLCVLLSPHNFSFTGAKRMDDKAVLNTEVNFRKGRSRKSRSAI